MAHSWHSSFSPATHVLTQMSPHLVIHCCRAPDHIFLLKPFLTKSLTPSLLLNPMDTLQASFHSAAFGLVDSSCLETHSSLTLLLSSCLSGSSVPVSLTGLSSCCFQHSYIVQFSLHTLHPSPRLNQSPLNGCSQVIIQCTSPSRLPSILPPEQVS